MKTVFAIWLTAISLLTYASADYSFEDDDLPTVLLPIGADFQADSKIASQKKQAIVVMFDAKYCGFCEILANEVLRPMQITQANSNYLIRKVEVNLDVPMTDFDGSSVTMSDFANRHNISVTPTLVFLDHRGKEGAQRIVGVNGVDLISYYIDSSIQLVSDKITVDTKPLAQAINTQ